ncbi:MAG: cytochrome b/b6 domain-containing protein [Deltaproteobacteria bacterium]|nr:cytochrome b/b6 domain-containing protein [Deltaproteobacteria bacterium]MBW2027034.1 cytochrome b/b6 domain-containing protein [Deltaproteobacteria bacterium]MBW2127096.1 cytochrome b/b6 domain-containing protein [Deltaproteobacteria bacterium]
MQFFGGSESYLQKRRNLKVQPKKKTRIKRFTVTQRIFHLLLILFFLILGSTGLARLYIETSWGKGIASFFGGYETSFQIHKVVGILMICCFLVHAVYLLFKVVWKELPRSLLGPESLLPHPRDIKGFFQHIAWFFHIAISPKFDRWSYWEKFDYWAVFWGIPILGITGLLLAYPVAASRIIPGWGLNVALWIHRIEAILAMAHVFIIHFFVTHLRRHNFPMDLTMFEGSADLEVTRHERPAWVTRLEESGKLNFLLASETSPRLRILYYLFGYIAMAVGIYLVIGGLANSGSITW